MRELDHQHETEFECEAPEDYTPLDAPLVRPEDLLELDAVEEPPVTAELTFPVEGLFSYYTPERKFAIKPVADALREAGRIWEARGKQPSVGIGDISRKGGGQLSGHASHRKGVDVDLRPLMRNNLTGPVTHHAENYSRELTQEWVDILHGNGVLAIKFIFFNDSAVANVSKWPHHDNHLHVRFYFPGERQSLPTIAAGDSHPAVRDVQRRLNFWIVAAKPAGITPLSVDGRFGTVSAEATRAFQTAHGLAASGRVTRGGTWEALPKAPLAAASS